MVNSGAKAIALISGAGGTGRTTVALNLAASLARQAKRVLLFDMCFGWGGLNSYAGNLPTFERLLDCDDDFTGMVSNVGGGLYLLTCIPPDFLDFDEDDMKRIAWIAHRLGYQYDCLILDPPSGAHPLALLAAGLSEQVCLFTTPDAASVASSYCLVKSLYSEGIYSRVRIVFSLVQSAEHAASLKTRFDIITSQFLKLKLADGGFVFRQADLEKDEFVLGEINEGSLELVRNLHLRGIGGFQNETTAESASSTFPILGEEGR